MLSRGKKIWIILLAAGFVILPLVLVLAHPRGRATIRLAPGFVRFEEDARVYYERGAEDLASRIADALPGAVARVEECQSRPFKTGFRVYVCSSHESFTRHIGQPVSDPVRGIAFMWDVWVSPKAFAFYGKDTHRQTLAHELSHLHLRQQLGWLRKTQRVPAWFVEGLADWVAGTGEEIVSRNAALKGFINGRHLMPDASGRLPLPKGAHDYGLTWPMFHLQSRMFIEYLHDRDEKSFGRFVAAVVDGDRFDVAFNEHFGDSLEIVWQEFMDALANHGLAPLAGR
jgi:hypothetical protein